MMLPVTNKSSKKKTTKMFKSIKYCINGHWKMLTTLCRKAYCKMKKKNDSYFRIKLHFWKKSTIDKMRNVPFLYSQIMTLTVIIYFWGSSQMRWTRSRKNSLMRMRMSACHDTQPRYDAFFNFVDFIALLILLLLVQNIDLILLLSVYTLQLSYSYEKVYSS